MANKDANLKAGWKNLAIWMPATILVALIIRVVTWIFLVYNNIYILEEQFNMVLALLLVSVLFPIIGYFSIYMLYSRAAAVNSTSLREVACSKKWIAPFVVFCVLEVSWCLISVVFLWITDNGGISVSMYLSCQLISMVIDIVMVICGKVYFKPDRVQQG